MKTGFNEGCNRFCRDHSVLKDLELCETYGFDYIDIQSDCLDRDLAAGKYTLEDLSAWFIGITLDQYHFHAMASSFEFLEKANGKKIFIWHLNGMENMPCGAAYNTDEKRLWPGEPGDCLDHERYADTLKKIGFDGDICTMEVFRPAYYQLSQEENVKLAAAITKKHLAKYW